MDHFYITLPSNSSEAYYGKQPMCNFKTRLAKPIQLPVDEWEVGLAEIIYPHTWKNVTDGDFRIKVFGKDGWVWEDVKIPSALYSSPAKLIEEMERVAKAKMTKGTLGNIHLHYNELLHKIAIHLAPGYMIYLPRPMAMILGFGDVSSVTLEHHREEDELNYGVTVLESAVFYNNSKIVPPFCVDLSRGMHTFFIYCNIVAYQLVGDTNVPLMRTIPVTGRNGEVVVNSFDNVHYMGLGRSDFQEVEVHITDDTGRDVPFEQGRVIVKLHFRKK